MFIVDDKRIATMRERLGDDASNLIKSDTFLPMFRNRQKEHPEEFEESIKIAKRKKNPSRYLASIWSLKNLKQTLEWLSNKVSQIKASIRERVAQRQKQLESKSYKTARVGSLMSLGEIIENRKKSLPLKA